MMQRQSDGSNYGERACFYEAVEIGQGIFFPTNQKKFDLICLSGRELVVGYRSSHHSGERANHKHSNTHSRVERRPEAEFSA